jgi:hypothetical protein
MREKIAHYYRITREHDVQHTHVVRVPCVGQLVKYGVFEQRWQVLLVSETQFAQSSLQNDTNQLL